MAIPVPEVTCGSSMTKVGAELMAGNNAMEEIVSFVFHEV
jgi:hypothetical protein